MANLSVVPSLSLTPPLLLTSSTHILRPFVWRVDSTFRLPVCELVKPTVIVFSPPAGLAAGAAAAVVGAGAVVGAAALGAAGGAAGACAAPPPDVPPQAV